MRINANTPTEPMVRISRDTQEPSVGSDPRQPNRNAVTRDSVQISDAGRAKAADAGVAFSPQRAQEIRQRILNGEYDSVHVLGNTARRLLERGDV